MERRTLAIVAGVLGAGALGAWLYDALVVTDEETIEQFVASVTGDVTAQSAARARATYVDLAAQPVEVDALGRRDVYREGDEAALERAIDRAVAATQGDTVRVLNREIAVEGDEAFARTRVLAAFGLMRVDWRLRRHSEQWRIARVQVRR